MSDRIGVMQHGRLEQVATPERLYDTPASAFVAGFIGSTNLLRGRRSGDVVVLDSGVRVPVGDRAAADATDKVLVSVRPEAVVLGDQPRTDGAVSLPGRVVEAVYLGASTRYTVRCDAGLELTAEQPHAARAESRSYTIGEAVTVGWNPRDCVVLADRD